MTMSPSSHNSHSSAAWRRHLSWTLFACSLILYVATSIWGRTRGESWLDAFGLTLDGDFLRLIGDLLVPLLAIVVMLRQTRSLPPSRERTILTWVGWSIFVFLLVWWLPLRSALFGLN